MSSLICRTPTCIRWWIDPASRKCVYCHQGRPPRPRLDGECGSMPIDRAASTPTTKAAPAPGGKAKAKARPGQAPARGRGQGLSPLQLRVLRQLGDGKARRPADLWREMGIAQGSLSFALKRVLHQRLAARRPLERDSRSYLVTITTKGRRRLEALGGSR